MLIDEESAKLRFCPFGRGAVPLGDKSGKFASGVNMSPNGPITTCEGSRCMLWETNQTIPHQLPCPECKNDDTRRTDCKTCEGRGTFVKHIVIGFCGAGFAGPVSVTLQEIKTALMQQTVVYAKGLGVDLMELFKKPEQPPVEAPGNSEQKPS